MKKSFIILLCLILITTMVACQTNDETPAETENTDTAESTETNESQELEGVAEGFGGELKVKVTKEGETISAVEVTENSETPDIASEALEEIPKRIVEANSTEVDIVSGATVTSEAIIYAVNNALDPDTYPVPVAEEEVEDEAEAISASDLYQGFGMSNMGRKGPGTDAEDVQVWSINQVLANTLFDEEGKIVSLHVDQLEVATPNYDGDGMPHFSGWPGQGGYNYDENHDGTITGLTEDTEENFFEEIETWETKRERGDAYVMGAGTWSEQMNAYEQVFVGKTVEEVQEWFDTYSADSNGRPLKEGLEDEGDAAKYDALSNEDKSMLAELTSSATMSLNDSHGNIVEAIRNSFENSRDINLTVQ